ncbi:MAG: pyruvate dehydrogenase complex dihydrolipoamide acetyltransferase [Xanthobacteraceae bacterium]
MDILMPQLGETVTEGKITKWFKAAGDAVKPGDNLFEIETDKTSMEVPATSAGVLAEIRVAEGDVVPVGAVVAVISGDGVASSLSQAPAATKPAASPPVIPAQAGIQNGQGLGPRLRGDERTASFAAPVRAPSQAPLDPFNAVRTPEKNFGPARLPGGTVTTPLARRLASEAGIDLSALSPSGPHGRIVARDVEGAAAKAGKSFAQPPTTALARGPGAERIKAMFAPGSFEEIPLDSMRRTIAARLVEAKQTIPHFYLTTDVVIERVQTVREEINATRAGDSAKISINDFVIKALALALQRVPAANAVFADDRILKFRASDIGVAVSIDGGLITPVIRDAQAKSIGAISGEIRDLAARARAKKLRPQEIRGGTSAVSNLGMYGVREFSAIINPPQATILAVGAAQRRPIEDDNGVRFVEQMTVTLSCDHRVVDGALGAELLAAFKLFMEHPVGMMV